MWMFKFLYPQICGYKYQQSVKNLSNLGSDLKFRVDDGLKDEFRLLCELKKIPISRLLRSLMKEEIENYLEEINRHLEANDLPFRRISDYLDRIHSESKETNNKASLQRDFFNRP